ncbi:MAG: helix-turn-helix domain-containing protein [Firmicutes bacterium]|nr:helix-turn-helix domain-containing protein [Bacillota bacterium]
MDRDSLSQSVGIVLREARVKAGLSQEALADRAGVDRTFVGRIENGKQSPTLDTLARMAQALGLRPSEVLRQAEKRSPVGYSNHRRSEVDSNGDSD